MDREAKEAILKIIIGLAIAGGALVLMTIL